MRLDRLETPALIVEEKTLLANMDAMDALVRDTELRLRPHYKSHKCAQLAKLQLRRGAVGMTCAKLGEALDLADAGVEDILIANQLVQPQKLRRAAELAADCRLTLCVDNADNADALERAAAACGTVLHCLVEFEIGMRRCGVTSHAEAAALAARIASHPHLRFEGVQAYAGHLSHERDEAKRRAATERNQVLLRGLLDCLEQQGTPARTLTGGSTGTVGLKAQAGLYTEGQPGSYLFMDAAYQTLGLPFRNALFVLSTIVSSRDGLAVADAGVKSCGVDQGMPLCRDLTAEEIAASEEHFQLRRPVPAPAVGDRVLLIPGHCCSTVNLHDRLYVVDEGRIIDRLAVTARGLSR